jgi:hypothetical protein
VTRERIHLRAFRTHTPLHQQRGPAAERCGTSSLELFQRHSYWRCQWTVAEHRSHVERLRMKTWTFRSCCCACFISACMAGAESVDSFNRPACSLAAVPDPRLGVNCAGSQPCSSTSCSGHPVAAQIANVNASTYTWAIAQGLQSTGNMLRVRRFAHRLLQKSSVTVSVAGGSISKGYADSDSVASAHKGCELTPICTRCHDRIPSSQRLSHRSMGRECTAYGVACTSVVAIPVACTTIAVPVHCFLSIKHPDSVDG